MIKVSEKYEPLFKAIAGELNDVDTIVITGGRDSAKSFTTCLALCEGAAVHNHRILFTRYTLTSAKDSIIPDFNEKIDVLNYGEYFHVTNDRILGPDKSKIVFKGIKTASGNQTASLKSLKDFSIFVAEEAEEFPSFDEWDKIQLSIRAIDVKSLNILILNPTSKKHWIYQEFFQNKGVKAGYNGIKGNILYIHTSYLDLDKQYIAPKNLRKYQEAHAIYKELDAMKAAERNEQPKNLIKQWKYYKYVVLGGWLETAEGIVYEDWDTFEDFPEEIDYRLFGLDFGFTNDPCSLVECQFKGNNIYAKEHVYKTRLLNKDLAELIQLAVGDEDAYIVADSASPKDIEDLNSIVAEKGYSFVVMPCVKGPGSILSGIKKVQDRDLHVHKDSKNMHDELDNYHTIEITNNKGEVKLHVIDRYNHSLDALRYAATRY